MRCYICQKKEYPFQDILQVNRSNFYSICEKCFIKHPAFIRIEVLPNMFDSIHIIHVIHDGTYPHEAYGFMFDAILKKVILHHHSFFLAFETLEEDLLSLLQLLPFGNLWIFNIQIQ